MVSAVVLFASFIFHYLTLFNVNCAAIGPKWPSRIIAYTIDESLSTAKRYDISVGLSYIEMDLIENGIKCIEFVKRTNEKYFVAFKKTDKHCTANIGFNKDNKKNFVFLSDGCIVNDIIHEVMHSLGFAHEQQRHDQQEHVNVSENVPDKFKSDFKMRSSSNESAYDTPYDYFSIMHYNSHAHGEDNILAKYPTLLPDIRRSKHHYIGRNDYLSPIDIIQVQRMYGCKETRIQHIQPLTLQRDHTRYSEMFINDANEHGISPNITYMYLDKTFATCGKSHYWPFNYPIVASKHKLYKTICIKKKKIEHSCKFSIECESNACVNVHKESKVYKLKKCVDNRNSTKFVSV